MDSELRQRPRNIGQPGLNGYPEPVLNITKLNQMWIECAVFNENRATQHNRNRFTNKIIEKYSRYNAADFIGRNITLSRKQTLRGHLIDIIQKLCLSFFRYRALVKQQGSPAGNYLYPLPTCFKHSRQTFWCNQVILKNIFDPFATGQFNASIPVPHKSQVHFILKYLDAFVPGGISHGNIACVIRRLIINDQYFEIRKCLGKNAV